jgi:hypothetical protein
MKETFQEWIDAFPWESEDQKRGFLAFVHWGNRLPPEVFDDGGDLILASLAFIIQKNLEAHQWWAGVMGDQIKDLQNQIALLRDVVADLIETMR